MEKQREVKTFELDFSECNTVGEIYKEIREELDLPQNCGRNLNALWDAVTGMMYTPARIIISKQVANKELVEVITQVIAVMHEAEDTYHQIKVVVK